MEIPYCPTVRPTMKEFQNFREFVQKLDQTYKKDYGIVKVVPPPEWRARKSDYEQAFKDIHINGPIQQNLYGKGGIYECLHIAKKSMSFEEYRQKSQELDKIVEKMSPQEIEDTFWKNIAFSPPLYGADLLNSVMEPCSGAWDLKSLDSILNDSLTHQIKGVNSPYCYVGQWKALFCWHKEDLDLSAINYVHKGKSKFWYAVRPDMGHLIQKQASRLFPLHFSNCSQFLRHKTILINPYLIKRKVPELVIHKVQQKQNQFVISFGGAYHCGFNFGFNFAQAVNYASLDWLRQITTSKSCNCVKSSVKASPLQIYNNLLKTNYVKTPQFQIFQQFIFKMLKLDEEESDDEATKIAIKNQFTKKIRKQSKQVSIKQLTYKGEKYDIDNWIECQKCKTWRIVNQKCTVKNFVCNRVGKKCSTKEKVPKKCFVIKAT